MEQPLISIRGVTRSLAAGRKTVPILRDVDLDIWRGEFVVITGASDASRSALMNILACRDRPASGSYHFDGRDVGALDPENHAKLRRERFGVVFQHDPLPGDPDVGGDLEASVIHADWRGRLLPCRPCLGRRPDRRHPRVAVAQISKGAEVILANEPTGALDAESRTVLIEWLRDLHQHGRTVIMATHDTSTGPHGHRTIEIRDGRILAGSSHHEEGAGTPRRAAMPQHPARSRSTGPGDPSKADPHRSETEGRLLLILSISAAFNIALLVWILG